MTTIMAAEYWIGHDNLFEAPDLRFDHWWEHYIPSVPEPIQHLEDDKRSQFWREIRRGFTGDVETVRKITDGMPVIDILTYIPVDEVWNG